MSNEHMEWVCNECGSHEYSSSISEEDLTWLSCGNCGSDEFHLEPKDSQS